jgi:hypothetical protein
MKLFQNGYKKENQVSNLKISNSDYQIADNIMKI